MRDLLGEANGRLNKATELLREHAKEHNAAQVVFARLRAELENEEEAPKGSQS